MSLLIKGGIVVNEGHSFLADLFIENGHIKNILKPGTISRDAYQEMIDVTGCFVLPGVIDEHVHFREPGMTAKADIHTESMAAAAGGVTSFLEMPNTNPQTITLDALEEKYRLAAEKSVVNFGFFYGATSLNIDTFAAVPRRMIPGIKLFMGASTGNMLVDKQESLERIFAACHDLGLPLMTHCEDTALINRNMREAMATYGDDPDISIHPEIRSAEACYASSALAVKLAKKYDTRLHIAHITTARELALAGDNVSLEACVPHLLFSDSDYLTKKALIKCNPAIKTASDRENLRQGLTNGKILTVATDHAPHLWKEKQGGAAKALSGMPMVQFSLLAMLELVNRGVLPLERLVTLMCHHPAHVFKIHERGFIREGHWADLAIIRPTAPWILRKDRILSKCGWSPLEGETFHWEVVHTLCNGALVYSRGRVDAGRVGKQLVFG
ncbi:dihydroorotase [Prevotella sp. A2931]|uniref:Dihydroorotase n=1 Tax=Prevotella illustrans TaxID=2800387 RepID=A0ABS3M3Z5_9BACT|nr:MULTISPECIES: dihydroorotase [Prevotella]MBO1362899.1 dihydroorotase [Prevotella illustrans]PTL25961.1 dihydroorotase [Prevotella sp. oral taxon 820]